MTQCITRELTTLGPTSDVDLLIAAAESALCHDGDLVAGRRLFGRAYRLAAAAGDPGGMALAALGAGGLWLNEQRTATGSALLSARLRHTMSLIDPRLPLGLRLRARLTAEAEYRCGESAKTLAMLAEIRDTGDPGALAEALRLAHLTVLGPDHGDLRVALADELTAVGTRTGRRGDVLIGAWWRAVDPFLAGDPRAADRLDDLRRLLADRDHLAIGFAAGAIDVTLAVRAGRLAEAETLAETNARRGTAAGDIDAVGWHGMQLVAIRWFQGRLPELLPMLEEMVDSPTLSEVDNSYFAMLALAAAQRGDHRTATGALATLRGTDLGDLPRSGNWLITMVGVVEAAALTGDIELATRAYELLRPFAHLPAIGNLGGVCFGSVHHALGVASLTTGHVDRATGHFQSAVRENRALAHRPAEIASQQRLAEAPARRGTPSRGALTCVRAGHSWRFDLGARSIVVEDSVGVHHLATLIAHPGRDVHAIDLATGTDTGATMSERTGLSTQPVLDRVAAQEYRSRIDRLDAEIERCEASGRPDRAATARAERDWLVAELAGASGFAGRSRRFTDGGERARIAVSKAIRRAVTRIAGADPAIGTHLRDTVRTGMHCAYTPSR